MRVECGMEAETHNCHAGLLLVGCPHYVCLCGMEKSGYVFGLMMEGNVWVCQILNFMNTSAQVIPTLDIIKHILRYPGPENEFKPVLWRRVITYMLLLMSSVSIT